MAMGWEPNSPEEASNPSEGSHLSLFGTVPLALSPAETLLAPPSGASLDQIQWGVRLSFVPLSVLGEQHGWPCQPGELARARARARSQPVGMFDPSRNPGHRARYQPEEEEPPNCPPEEDPVSPNTQPNQLERCPWKKPHARGFVYLNKAPTASKLYVSGAWKPNGKTDYKIFTAVFCTQYEDWRTAPWQLKKKRTLSHDAQHEPKVPPTYDIKFYAFGEWSNDWRGPPKVVGTDLWVAAHGSDEWEEWRTTSCLIGPYCSNHLKIQKFQRAQWLYHCDHKW